MKSTRLLISGLLVMAGALISHSLGYALTARGVGATGHEYTNGVGVVAGPLILAIVAMTVARLAMRSHNVQLSWPAILGAQAGLFLVQESLEALTGQSNVAGRAVIVGLLVQPLVLWALRQFVRATHAFVELLATVASLPSLAVRPVWAPRPVLLVVPSEQTPNQRRRGPPQSR